MATFVLKPREAQNTKVLVFNTKVGACQYFCIRVITKVLSHYKSIEIEYKSIESNTKVLQANLDRIFQILVSSYTIWGIKTGWQAMLHRHRLLMSLKVQWERQMTLKESNQGNKSIMFKMRPAKWMACQEVASVSNVDDWLTVLSGANRGLPVPLLSWYWTYARTIIVWINLKRGPNTCVWLLRSVLVLVIFESYDSPYKSYVIMLHDCQTWQEWEHSYVCAHPFHDTFHHT